MPPWFLFIFIFYCVSLGKSSKNKEQKKIKKDGYYEWSVI